MESILAKRKYPRGTVATEEFSMKELYIKLLPDKTPKLQVLILKGKCLLKTENPYTRGCLVPEFTTY